MQHRAGLQISRQAGEHLVCRSTNTREKRDETMKKDGSMNLTKLSETIARIAATARCAAYRPKLRADEAATRLGLIDPLLRALGWDTLDPKQVGLEVPAGKDFADYVLYTAKGPRIVVEAKKLEGLTTAADKAVQGYALLVGAPWIAVTDGMAWRVGRLVPPKNGQPIGQKDHLAFRLDAPPGGVALQALWLWRANHEPGPPEQCVNVDTRPPPQPLPQRETLASFRPAGAKDLPVILVFPDGSERQARKGFELRTHVAQWLAETGRLKREHCPVRGQRGAKSNPLVGAHPDAFTGAARTNVKKIGSTGLYVTGNSNPANHALAARQLLKTYGVSTEEVGVK